jgi:hypothetical protein
MEAAMLDVEAVRRAVDPKASGKKSAVRCPVHDDERPSCAIDLSEEGALLARCYAGCEQSVVFDAVLEKAGLKREATGQRREWIYTDVKGKPIRRVVRIDEPGKEKIIWQEHLEGTEWVKGSKGLPYTLLWLAQLIETELPTVVVVEGEAAAESARTMLVGLAFVTTWPGGVPTASKVDIEPLRGRNVVLWPDKDEHGRKAMATLQKRLAAIGVNASVFVPWVDLPAKGDAVDAVRLLHTADEFFARLDELEADEPAAHKEPTSGGGAALLCDVETWLRRFVSYPSDHACVAHALWVAHTHAMQAWESTPRIAFLSPEPGSGKSRALEASEPLVPNPVEAVNVTPAYLFRKVGAREGRPTILFDEVDTVFGPRAKNENEEIRGLLNAGHRRHGVAGRCVVRGKEVFTEEIPAYCAVALAGLGGLPDTILSRCVIVRMRRRAPGEQVEAFRRRVHEDEGHVLRDRLADWAEPILDQLSNAWPTMPEGVSDRNADVWEALLAVADAAGGEWPQRARLAAAALVADSKQSTPSLGVRLLADLKSVFGERDVMSTEEILNALCGLDEAPWADIKGKPLDSRGLASRLRPYGVKSTTIRIDRDHTPKGYTRADL